MYFVALLESAHIACVARVARDRCPSDQQDRPAIRQLEHGECLSHRISGNNQRAYCIEMAGLTLRSRQFSHYASEALRISERFGADSSFTSTHCARHDRPVKPSLDRRHVGVDSLTLELVAVSWQGPRDPWLAWTPDETKLFTGRMFKPLQETGLKGFVVCSVLHNNLSVAFDFCMHYILVGSLAERHSAGPWTRFRSGSMMKSCSRAGRRCSSYD